MPDTFDKQIEKLIETLHNYPDFLTRERDDWVDFVADQRGHRLIIETWWDDQPQIPSLAHVKIRDRDRTFHPSSPAMWLKAPVSPREAGYHVSYDCSNCGEWPTWEYVDDTQTRTDTECPYPDGFVSTALFTTTSGKIVLRDSLRDVYNLSAELEDSFASYNTSYGQYQVVQANFEIGCAYGPVGNSCPGFYEDKQRPGHFVIANGLSSDYSSDDEDQEAIARWEAQYKDLGGFITDLWAYSIADYDDYVSKGGKPEPDEVVEFGPGTYRFYHHTTWSGFNRDDDYPIIYADIVRVNDPN